MNIEKVVNVTYKVRPVFFDFNHELPYEGPCRFGSEKELDPESDVFLNNEVYNGFQMGIKHNMPEGVEILDPLRYKNHTDNWTVSEKEMQTLYQGMDETDFYFVSTTGRTGEMIVEFAQHVKKPIAMIGNDIGITIVMSSLLARGLEAYAFLSWKDAGKQLSALRVKKALAQTRVLLAPRFNGNLSLYSAQDSFIDLEKVTAVLGSKFRYINIHELIDQSNAVDPTSNYTTPGRLQPNINGADMVEIKKLTDDLIANADECEMETEAVLQSVKMYHSILKQMEHHDCNAFTAVCPDACSTCRMDQDKFTFCISHSLNNENGIPSACEYDISAVLSKVVMATLANKATYMGNTILMSDTDGCFFDDGYQQHFNQNYITKAEMERLKGVPNLIITGHSVPNRKMKGYDAEPVKYAIRPFAYSGFGATMRYNFKDDEGQVVTMMRFSANCDKLFVAKGTIKSGFGYELHNCTLGVIIQVEDSRRFYKNQLQAGNHVPFVYGDVFDEIVMLGESLGLEVIVG